MSQLYEINRWCAFSDPFRKPGNLSVTSTSAVPSRLTTNSVSGFGANLDLPNGLSLAAPVLVVVTLSDVSAYGLNLAAPVTLVVTLADVSQTDCEILDGSALWFDFGSASGTAFASAVALGIAATALPWGWHPRLSRGWTFA